MQIAARPKVNITFVDAKGKSTYTSVWLPMGTAEDVALGYAIDLAGIAAALSDASVVRCAVVYATRTDVAIQPRSALVETPQAQFLFSLTSDPDLLAEITVPLDPSWILTDGPLTGFGLDLANAEVVELTEFIRDGVWCDPFGVDLADCVSAHTRELE